MHPSPFTLYFLYPYRSLYSAIPLGGKVIAPDKALPIHPFTFTFDILLCATLNDAVDEVLGD